jgi:hypothetical protein
MYDFETKSLTCADIALSHIAAAAPAFDAAADAAASAKASAFSGEARGDGGARDGAPSSRVGGEIPGRRVA